jgi:hypothetical protein
MTIICWRCHSNSVNTGSRLPYLSDVKTRKRQNVVRIDMIRNNRIKLFYLYQRLQCTDIYFFKIQLISFFIYCCDCTYMNQNHERNTICLDIFLLSDRQYLLSVSWHLHITITYHLLHLRLRNMFMLSP